MINVVAGGDGTMLKKQVLAKLGEDESWTTGTTENFEKVMKEVAVQFRKAENRKSKIIVLSVVGNVVPYATVEKHIVSLSRYMYNKAKVFARQSKGRDSTEPKKVLQRYNRVAVQNFVDFITSPAVMIGLPYGSRKVKLSNGTKYEIQDTIRQQSSTEIYHMYTQLLQNTNQTDLSLSKSTIFRILDACAATDRKATTCVDYFTANGKEAFDGLRDIIDYWISEGLSHNGTLQQLKTQMFESEEYLRTDYRLHIKPCSRIPDHCAILALSDPTDENMKASCSSGSREHKYDLKCDRCELVSTALQQMEIYSKQFNKEIAHRIKHDPDYQPTPQFLEKRKEEDVPISKYTTDIQEMKRHYLRAAYTGQERESIITNLNDSEVLLTIDFAQKYLPRWHREKQNDYFGKKGISYHICHATAKVGTKYTQHSFVHIYDNEVTQDSRLVVLTLSHVLSELKKVGIKKVSIRSDNAGSYHSATTINSLHWLQEKTQMPIGTYTFSEAQNGKSASDRDASRVKRKAETYVASGNDITTSGEFFNALKDGRLLNGMSIYHGSVKVDAVGSSKWPGITSWNHFTVEQDGIRGRRYGGIGKGQLMTKDSLKPMNGTCSFAQAGFVASGVDCIYTEQRNVLWNLPTKFWYHSECASHAYQTSTCIEEEDNVFPETDEPMFDDNGKLFHCPEVGC